MKMSPASDQNRSCCNDSESALDYSKLGASRRPSYWALALLLIPSLTLFGNLLVIISVVIKRSLHSPINYFILGLAVADMCVAMAVMPFAVYVEFNEHWELGTVLCDLYCAADVTCSTASIFLLTVISFDRYVAATQPIRYANSAKSIGRVAVINFAVWLVSMLIASPMVLGLNNVPHRDLSKCMFYNADFIIYSSTGSFCIPLVIIVYLYARIYCVIRRRGRFAKRRQDQISAASRCSVVTGGLDSVEKPLALPRATLAPVIEYPLSRDTSGIEENKPLPDAISAISCANCSDPDERQNRCNGFASQDSALKLWQIARKPEMRSNSLCLGQSVLEAPNANDYKTVLRSYSSGSAPPTHDSNKLSEVCKFVRRIGPEGPHSIPSHWPRCFSLPGRRQPERKTRHWSLARSTNVVREAHLNFDPPAVIVSKTDAPFSGQETPISLLDETTGSDDTAKIIRSARISSASTSPRVTRRSSVAIDSGSSVLIISPATNGSLPSTDGRRSTGIAAQSRSPKSSFSAMINGVRRLHSRKRMSEGCSPLLRQRDRSGLFDARPWSSTKGSMDEVTQAAKLRWLRRLSTGLVLWRLRRDGRLTISGQTTETTTSASAVDRESMKQPLLRRQQGRLRAPRKGTSKSQRKEKKATKTLAIVLGIFLVCWLPFFALNLLNAVCIKLNKQMCQLGFLPFFLTTWLGYTNSLMNPIIYTIFNADFRRAFKEILCSVFCADRRVARA